MENIYLAPINITDPVCLNGLIPDLENSLPLSFHLYPLSINMRTYFSGERQQYHSSKILEYLLQIIPAEADKIIGVCDEDIYVPILTFLFGEAQFKGRAAIVSTHRLRDSFYGLPDNSDLLRARLEKEINHELGHLLGLVHCKNYRCVMHSSTYVEDIDLKEKHFCEMCRVKIILSDGY